MMADLFAVLCAASAVVATFARSIKTAVLALWIAGLAVGGLYLTLGTDTLAVIQWTTSTLIAVSFVFFSMMFGEFSGDQNRNRGWAAIAGRLVILLAGGGFAALVFTGIYTALKDRPTPGPIISDLATIGKIIANDYFLSFEVLALLLFLVLVGGGVVARPDQGEAES